MTAAHVDLLPDPDSPNYGYGPLNEQPDPEQATDQRLRNNQCVWCGVHLGEARHHDTFDTQECQTLWHEWRNGSAPVGGGLRPTDEDEYAPRGAVPDNPLSEPWWRPRRSPEPTIRESAKQARERRAGAATPRGWPAAEDLQAVEQYAHHTPELFDGIGRSRITVDPAAMRSADLPQAVDPTPYPLEGVGQALRRGWLALADQPYATAIDDTLPRPYRRCPYCRSHTRPYLEQGGGVHVLCGACCRTYPGPTLIPMARRNDGEWEFMVLGAQDKGAVRACTHHMGAPARQQGAWVDLHTEVAEQYLPPCVQPHCDRPARRQYRLNAPLVLDSYHWEPRDEHPLILQLCAPHMYKLDAMLATAARTTLYDPVRLDVWTSIY